MPENEKTSPTITKLAARALSNPLSLTPQEIQALAASALTQAPDKPEPRADDTVTDYETRILDREDPTREDLNPPCGEPELPEAG